MLHCGKNKIIQTVVVSEFGDNFKQIAFDALDKSEKQTVTDLAVLKKKQIETKDCPQVCPEKTIKIPYDLHQKDKIGLGNDGNVNLMYTLTIYYASAPPTSCCESGTIEFKGDLTVKGSYKPFFDDKVTVTAKTNVKGDDSFSSCSATGKDQCKKVFKDDLDLGFPFKVPSNPIPGLKSWEDSHVKIKGDFTVTVITKKTN